MFGPKAMGTLHGFVFLSHQFGSFAGVWLGGQVFDLYGADDLVWAASIALGALSALVHLPIRDRAWAPQAARGAAAIFVRADQCARMAPLGRPC